MQELAKALCKAQSEMGSAHKGATAGKGGSFSYNYADLASVWETVRKPLSSNGLSIVQTTKNEGDIVSVCTMLLHTSGEHIESCLSLKLKDPSDPKALGSALTYLRRYGIMGTVGVAPSDDDGDAANEAKEDKAPQPTVNQADIDTFNRIKEEIETSADIAALEANYKSNKAKIDKLPAALAGKLRKLTAETKDNMKTEAERLAKENNE